MLKWAMFTLALAFTIIQQYNTTELAWSNAVGKRDWQECARVLSEMKVPTQTIRDTSLIAPETYSMLVHRFPEVVNMPTKDGLPAAFCFAAMAEELIKGIHGHEGSSRMLAYLRVFVLAGGDLGAKQGKKSLTRGTDADTTLEKFINWAMPEILPEFRELVEMSKKRTQ